MKIKLFVLVFVSLFVLATFTLTALAASDEAIVRAAMERTFAQLRAGDYATLYNALPEASRQRISRERFASGLQRAHDSYGLNFDRLNIEAVHVGGDVAVVDTVMYGRIARPIEGAGKVVARQYLVREGGQWRVAVGSRATMQPLLARNPKLARQYPPREPHIYIERNGRWIELGSPKAMRRRAAI